MKLKYQLLLLGLLSLVLPITGWVALKSVDQEFRHSIEQASKNTLSSLQASVQQMLKNNSDYNLYGLVMGQLDEIILDGDNSDWQSITTYKYQHKKQKLRIQIATVANKLSLLIHSNDNSKGGNNLQLNDHIIIGLANDRGLFKFVIPRQAEGEVVATQDLTTQLHYQAYWHELATGYNLEIQFNQANFHHLGVAGVNVETQDKIITGTLQSDNDLKLLPIIANNQQLLSAIASITPNNNHFSIADSQNRIIYQSNKLPNNQKISAWQWLVTPIYQWFFDIDDNNNWFYRQSDGMAGVITRNTSNEVTYELRTMLPQGQQNMIQSLLKASLLMIGAVLLIMFAYLLYALILAWRIRHLNRALQSVLDDSGKVHVQMPSHAAKDEIGQLSRGIESMLAELREYTKYLKDLGSRLSHEMKTPLAIVQTSLDNIEQEQDSEFLQRAKDGTNRLKFILNQLSELSQLQYSMESTPKQRFNLTELCKQLGKSYQSYIPNLKLNITTAEIFIDGCADLIAQLIDKLLENAVDFTPPSGFIELELHGQQQQTFIIVRNSGSQLPTNQQLNIFDSLVSQRDKKSSSKSHLGLGLYIVQLIAKYHHGKVFAKNLSRPQRVEVSVTIATNE